MKKKLILFLPAILLTIAISSCNQETGQSGCGFELKLTQMQGTIANSSPQGGEDMAWQESIFLYNDSSFTKRKTQGGTTTEKSGTYASKRFDNDTREYIELTYHSPNALVESCNSAEGIELILIVSASKFQGTWNACDGPTLVYEKSIINCLD